MVSALEFRHFFGLQLVSFNIKQYWEFARKFYLFQNFYLSVSIAIFFRPCYCFKRLFAFEYYSVAYVFSMINLLFE